MNEIIAGRISALRKSLMAAFEGGKSLANAMIGAEREAFVQLFLEHILPQTLRHSSGVVVDSLGSASGQIDIIIELPFFPSFPMIPGTHRVVPTEAIGAALEVKSNLAKSWHEVSETVGKLAALRRRTDSHTGSVPIFGFPFEERVPTYAIGFVGYRTSKSLKTALEKLPTTHRPCGALIVDSGAFVGQRSSGEGDAGMYLFVADLLLRLRAVTSLHNDPYLYLDPPELQSLLDRDGKPHTPRRPAQ